MGSHDLFWNTPNIHVVEQGMVSLCRIAVQLVHRMLAAHPGPVVERNSFDDARGTCAGPRFFGHGSHALRRGDTGSLGSRPMRVKGGCQALMRWGKNGSFETDRQGE